MFTRSKSLLSSIDVRLIVVILILNLGISYNKVTAQLSPRPVGTTKAPWGYYEYLPQGYSDQNTNKLPLLISLSGYGERGNGSSELDRVLRHGPLNLIKSGKWDNIKPSSTEFVVIGPQSFGGFYDKSKLVPFIDEMIKRYNVDPNRVYLVGLSWGAESIWTYLAYHRDKVAAVVPIAGKGQFAVTTAGCKFKNIPIWAFHGASDGTVNVGGSIMPVEYINNCSPKPEHPVKLTIYPSVGHNSWSRTYDLSGMNSATDSKYDPYNTSIYEWLLLHKKDDPYSEEPISTEQPLVANAGSDISVPSETTEITLDGSKSEGPGDISFSWQQVSGDPVEISNPNTAKPTISNLKEGSCTLKLTISDQNTNSASDEVSVIVVPTNQLNSDNGLMYEYFEGTGWAKIPDFSSMTPKKTGTVSTFALSPRTRNSDFGFRYIGEIDLPTEGTYTFYTSSDDGSKLYINNQLVVDNDGLHAKRERKGQITLDAGRHKIQVDFFEKSGGEVLEVRYAGPGISKRLISNNVLYPVDSEPVSEQPTPEPNNDNGLMYEYFEGTGWAKIPDFSSMTPKKTGTVSTFALSPRTRNSDFGFRYIGEIDLLTEGTYTFYTSSDDGSKLYIDNQLIVDNDGLHPKRERKGQITLDAGRHKIQVDFFEKSGGEVLEVRYAGPGISKRLISSNVLYPVDSEPVSEKPVDENPPSEDRDCNCDHIITPDRNFINLLKYPDLMDIRPGDVICIQAGTYEYLGLYGFEGTADQPITFKNCGGQVVIDGAPTVGLTMNGNKHFRLTGTGDKNYNYGIVIKNSRIQSFAISTLSTDFEIDHLEIRDGGDIGMHIVTKPTCDPATWRENFTMRNISVHDNYIHDVGGEALYMGSSFYRTGHKRTCDGETIYAMPHNIEGVRIYNNRMEHMGRDGFQFSCIVRDCKVYNNIVLDYGKLNDAAHNAGIVVGGGTTGELFNNIVGEGTGGGIHVFGIGNNHVYNNIVYDAGENGILLGNKTTNQGNYYWVNNNTIVNPKDAGVRLNLDDRSANNKIMNNFIVAPGLLSFYQDRNPLLGYIYYDATRTVDMTLSSNVLIADLEDAKFINPSTHNYQLMEDSPAIDAGIDLSSLGINADLLEQARPMGNTYDAGAYEKIKSMSSNSSISPFDNSYLIKSTYPNPVQTSLTVKYENVSTGLAQLQILTNVGDIILSKSISISESNGSYTLDLTNIDIPEGTFYVKLIDSKETTDTRTLLKVN